VGTKGDDQELGGLQPRRTGGSKGRVLERGKGKAHLTCGTTTRVTRCEHAVDELDGNERGIQGNLHRIKMLRLRGRIFRPAGKKGFLVAFRLMVECIATKAYVMSRAKTQTQKRSPRAAGPIKPSFKKPLQTNMALQGWHGRRTESRGANRLCTSRWYKGQGTGIGMVINVSTVLVTTGGHGR